MNDTATVRIFLTKGSPTSVRTADISNWTGKAVAGLRSQIDDILSREEACKPGVYFLADYEFSSPSAAAAVVHGGQANDLTAWKDGKGIKRKRRTSNNLLQAMS
jgi:hypothetical protein